jgi:hypothetical protein
MINEQLTKKYKRRIFVQLAAAHLCSPADECDVAALSQQLRLAQRDGVLADWNLLH